MTDNTILPGTGETYASKDRGGIKFQQVLTDVPLAAYGELRTAPKTRQVSLKYSYGVIPEDTGQALTNKTGSTVTVVGAQAVVTCEAVPESFSQIRTKDYMRYTPGVGSEMTGTCIFTPGVANSSQVFGSGDDDEGFFFGYNGTAFGVLHRNAGALEIKSLTITAGASSSGNITITMDGGAIVIAVAASDTISEICEKITAETAAFGNAGRGWEVINQDDNTLNFLSLVAENATGTFSFVDTDTTGVTASAFSEKVPGAAPVDTWIPQTSWNIDKMDGSGPSGVILDTSKGNIYRVEFQYHGYGNIMYSVEDSNTGKFQEVHSVKYANTATIPSLVNPTLSLTLIAKTEAGYTGGSLVMKTVSKAGFIQNNEIPFGLRSSMSDSKSITTVETPLMIIVNSLVFNGRRNKINVLLTSISFSSESTKTTEFVLYRDVDSIAGGVALTDINTGQSVISHGSVGSAITGGARFGTIVIAGGQSGVRELIESEFRIRPGERWVITARVSSGSAADVSASLTLLEEE